MGGAVGTKGAGSLRAVVGALKGWLVAPPRERQAWRAKGELEVAVATLFASVVRVGSSQRPPAWAAAAQALSRLCRLDADDAWALMGAARERAPEIGSYSPLASVLNRHWSARQKLRFTRHMWRVARADGRISYHQNRLVHSLAAQLDVPDADILRARDRIWFF